MTELDKKEKLGTSDYNSKSLEIYQNFVKLVHTPGEEAKITIVRLAHDARIVEQTFYYYYPEGVHTLTKELLTQWLDQNKHKIFDSSMAETFLNLATVCSLKDSDVLRLKKKLRRPQYIQALAWLTKEVITRYYQAHNKFLSERELMRLYERYKDVIFGRLLFAR